MPQPARSARPAPAQIKRRRRAAVAACTVVAVAAIYAVLNFTVLAPADTHGAKVEGITIQSQAVGESQAVTVVIPPGATPRHRRPLLVFLHGRNETRSAYTEDEPFFEALARLGKAAPIVAIPEGSADSYWHDRASGNWEKLVINEVIPAVTDRFAVDATRVAVGGISMGGFGAYDLALKNPGRFCAVGGHSPALWLQAEDTAPGAFDGAEDFERNDVLAMLRTDPGAFGPIPIWNDAGDEDPFLISDVALRETLESGGADLTAHTWPGGHKRGYWDQHWVRYLRFYANALAHCGAG